MYHDLTLDTPEYVLRQQRNSKKNPRAEIRLQESLRCLKHGAHLADQGEGLSQRTKLERLRALSSRGRRYFLFISRRMGFYRGIALNQGADGKGTYVSQSRRNKQ